MKSRSQLHLQPKQWLFIPELDVKARLRASSQLSTTHHSEDKVEFALKHMRQMSNPSFTPVPPSEERLEPYQPAQFTIKKADPVLLNAPEDELMGDSAPISSEEGAKQVVNTLLRATQQAQDFVMQANQPSSIFQRVSSLPPLHSPQQFPNTLEVLKSKETRRQGYKEPSPPPRAHKSHQNQYHGAWYLPPAQWKVAISARDTISKYSLQRGESHIAKAPYYYLHSEGKQTPIQFEENVKKFQRMPMMSRFKGHLEASNKRIPPFLQSVKSDKELEVIQDSDTMSSSET